MANETSEMPGETLEQRLARGPLEPRVALDILRGLLKTLAFLHWSGRVHGNITPKNIVIAPDGRVALTGVALGRADAARPPLPIPETPAYPGYLAPEQVGGLAPDARTDVFAVGVIAYEMLTGQNPFGAGPGVDAHEVMGRIAREPAPQLPPSARAALPANVVWALETALARMPDSRFANAEAFQEAVDSAATATMHAPAPIGSPQAMGAPMAAADPPRKNTRPVTTVPAIVSSSTTTEAPTTTTEAPTTTTEAPTTTLPPLPAVTRFEDDNPGVEFTGNWATSTDDAYSDRSFQHANGSGATATITFYGSSLAWIAKQGPSYGIAEVTLDGADPITVDLYSAEILYQHIAWETGPLTEGPHTVKIAWTGDRNEAASGANISVDAFEIAGELVDVTRIEQTNNRLDFSGAWNRASAGEASGGNFQYADAAEAKVTIEFTGRALSIIAKKGPNYGEAIITLAGTRTFTMDFYSAEEEWKATVWSSGLLPDGDHTVTIQWSGTKNPLSTGTNISLDALDLVGALR